MYRVNVSIHLHTLNPSTYSSSLTILPLLSAEEERSREGTGEEGAVEGEKGGEAAEKGRRGGGGGRGECPARGGSPGERLPPSRPARAGKDEREAAEEDLLQEEQDGQCLYLNLLTGKKPCNSTYYHVLTNKTGVNFDIYIIIQYIHNGSFEYTVYCTLCPSDICFTFTARQKKRGQSVSV